MTHKNWGTSFHAVPNCISFILHLTTVFAQVIKLSCCFKLNSTEFKIKILASYFAFSSSALELKAKLSSWAVSFLKKLFYWSIVDLWCCVDFHYTARWFIYIIHTYIYIYILFILLSISGLSQDIEYSSLCYTVGHCCLSILYIIVCIC